MEILEVMKNRHSVRRYLDKPIDGNVITTLCDEIHSCNEESGLNIQLFTNEPNAFSGFMARYGRFVNVKNYIALVGKNDSDLDEKIGYYGERIVLKAAILGLNSCWVAVSYNKKKTECIVGPAEKLGCIISIGYGENQGIPHKNKPLEKLCKVGGEMPHWFQMGMEAAQLAPTAINQQKFLFTLNGDTVKAEATGGPYSQIDLGIVKYHFEAVAGSDNFKWA